MEQLLVTAQNKTVADQARKALAGIEGVTIRMVVPAGALPQKTLVSNKKTAAKERVLSDIREGMKEVAAIRAGEKVGISVETLLAELREEAKRDA